MRALSCAALTMLEAPLKKHVSVLAMSYAT